MSTTPTVPYRLEFSVEVPGTPEQVWQAIATAKGMSAWFLPTEMEERQGGSLHFSMGPEMGSDGHVTDWDPPHRLVYQEDWAALMGKDPAELSPLTSEFLVQAQSGGTCIVRVTSSGFGTGADWESEFWADMGTNWMPFFDNLRLYLTYFPGQEATQLEATSVHSSDAATLWAVLRDALGLGHEGAAVTVRDTSGTVERVGERQALIRLSAPVPGLLTAFTHDAGNGHSTAGIRAYLFSADAADTSSASNQRGTPGCKSSPSRPHPQCQPHGASDVLAVAGRPSAATAEARNPLWTTIPRVAILGPWWKGA